MTLLGLELNNIYIAVWAIYGILAGIAGVLLGMFLGVSSYSVGPLTASAFSIVVLGGLGQRVGLTDRRFRGRLSGNLHRLCHFPSLPDDSCAASPGCCHVHPPAGAFSGGDKHASLTSRLFWIAVVVIVIASTLPLYVSGYILGLLTVAYYFGVLRHVLGSAVRICRGGEFPGRPF